LGGGNRVGEFSREGVGNKLMVRVLSTLNPKVKDLGGEGVGGVWNVEVVMDVRPERGSKVPTRWECFLHGFGSCSWQRVPL